MSYRGFSREYLWAERFGVTFQYGLQLHSIRRFSAHCGAAVLPAAPQVALADAVGGQLRVLHVVCAEVHPHPFSHHRYRLFSGSADGA